jgi:eukaryotic-like serine/threonine-protein kinase
MIGKTVSHYRILEKLGGGGMGVVYKAEDTKLGRFVALKFLPTVAPASGRHATGATALPDPAALERFKREARAASALNHPNICTIHDIDEVEGQPFIVMELLEGQTLRERLAAAGSSRHGEAGGVKPPLQTDALLDLAIQIANGLDAAHSKGIFHRDIKPANIFITTQGQAKILDFGLAKLAVAPVYDRGPDDAAYGAALRQDTPTATIDPEYLTSPGTAMGTIAYMSPEQALARQLDARSDLFSFGAVLYEMATGRPAFAGDSSAAIFDSILHKTPVSPLRLNPELPAGLEAVISKALEKDREMRYQHTSDLRTDLRRLLRDTTSGRTAAAEAGGTTRPTEAAPVTGPKPHGRRIRLAAVLAIAVLGGAALAYRYLRPGHKLSGLPLRIVPFTSSAGGKGNPAFSPDGNAIAYSWAGEKDDNADIYVKLIGAGVPLRLTTDPARDVSPAWSPDGRFIAFLRSSKGGDAYYLVPALGGPERKLADSYRKELGGNSLDWSPDGKFLVVADRVSPQDRLRILLISVESGEKKAVASPSDPFLASPRFSPDGKTIAFVAGAGFLAQDIFLVPVSGGEPNRVTLDKRGLRGLAWTPNGKEIIFSSDRGGLTSLWRVPISGGTPELVSAAGEDAFQPTVSSSGSRLAYLRDRMNLNVWRTAGPAWTGPRIAPAKLISSSREQADLDFSPDGKRIVFASDRSGSWEIWTCASDGSNPAQLTSLGSANTGTPQWSPDGKQIVFDSRKEGNSDIYLVSAEGGEPRRLTNGPFENNVPSWSRDGKWIYFSSDRTGAWQIWKIPAGGGNAIEVTKQGAFQAFESTDGRFLYYCKHYSDAPGIWKMPVDGGEEVRVLEEGRVSWWAVLSQGICLMHATSSPTLDFYDFATQHLKHLGAIDLGRAQGEHGFAVSPDGKWVLYTRLDQLDSDIMLVENFE